MARYAADEDPSSPGPIAHPRRLVDPARTCRWCPETPDVECRDLVAFVEAGVDGGRRGACSNPFFTEPITGGE